MRLSLEPGYDVVNGLWHHRLVVLEPGVGRVHLDLPPTERPAVDPHARTDLTIDIAPEGLAAGLRRLADALDGLARKDAA